jgi:hypothetical protein
LKYLGLDIYAPEENPLEIVGKGLMVSAAIELAYMLFTDGPDEALNPLILGLSSAALITASREALSFPEAAVIAVTCLAIAILFHVKRIHFPNR